jgi:hypothetical protein
MTPDQILSSAARDDADRLLTVAECAQQVRMSHDFIRAEIRSGRLEARCHLRPSGRTRYRIEGAKWAEYFARVWRSNVPRET